MTTACLGNPGISDSRFYCALDNCFRNMMPSFYVGPWVNRPTGSGKYILLNPTTICILVFPFQSIRQVDSPKSLFEIPIVD